MLIAELLCYMTLHGQTVDLEQMCGRSQPPAIVQSNVRSDAQQSFLEAYERMARLEQYPINQMMLRRHREQTQLLLSEGYDVCVASSDRARDERYMARVSNFRRLWQGVEREYLLTNNRVVYVLARTYLCN